MEVNLVKKMEKQMIERKKLFKWVGGKKWIKEPLNEIINHQKENNHKIDTYVEPCVGGLGSFLAVAQSLVERGIKNVYLNDINDVLISTFTDLQNKNVSLLEEYMRIEREYAATIPRDYRVLTKDMSKKEIKTALKPAEVFFKAKRVEYNSIKDKASLKRSALFIFLMQHVFNGVYRENKSGGLNTPYNWEPKIANQIEKQLLFTAYKRMFNHFNLHFSSVDIFTFLKEVPVDWNTTICYIDPPFMNEKNNELKYNKDQFTKDNQKQLLTLVKEENIVNIIYSNHDFPLFLEFAEEMDLTVKKFYRSNRINPANATKIAELLIFKNYEDEKMVY